MGQVKSITSHHSPKYLCSHLLQNTHTHTHTHSLSLSLSPSPSLSLRVCVCVCVHSLLSLCVSTLSFCCTFLPCQGPSMHVPTVVAGTLIGFAAGMVSAYEKTESKCGLGARGIGLSFAIPYSAYTFSLSHFFLCINAPLVLLHHPFTSLCEERLSPPS